MSPIPEKFLGSGSIFPYRSGRTDIFSTTLRLFCCSAIAARRGDIAHCARQEGRRYRLRRRAIDSGPLSSSDRQGLKWPGR
jgi:hypothetical protein